MSTPSFVPRVILFSCAVLATASACKPAEHGKFTSDAYEQTQYHYVVVAPDASLGPDWAIDNYYHSKFTDRLEPKRVDMYMTTYGLDMDGDGQTDTEQREATYDLRYTHKQRDAVVWLRTFPISNALKETELRILVRRYVDEIAGAGYEAVRLTGENRVVTEKRYAAELVEQSDAKLAGMPAYVATIDVANIDQIKLTPSSRHTRVQLVLARTNFTYEVSHRGEKSTFPVLMMAGYANLPEDFDKDLGAFRKLLAQIDVQGQRGFAPMPSVEPAAADGGAPKPPTAGF